MAAEQPQTGRGRSVVFIGLAFVLVLLALYITTQVVSVLFGIILPPTPPLPGGVSEVSHESTDYGVDSWVYSSGDTLCDVVSFYETNGGTCIIREGECGREETTQVPTTAQAQCVGNVPFSIFHMQWSADLFGASSSSTRIELSREVFWIGTGPTTTPQFDVGQLSPSPNATNEP